MLLDTNRILNNFIFKIPVAHTNAHTSRCMDFATNPYATVLVPEPMDYFSACSATSMCEAKCRAEFVAFDRQLALEEESQQQQQGKNLASTTVERTTESMLFVDLDQDAYTPMDRIMAMVELSDCRYAFLQYQPAARGTHHAAGCCFYI